MEAEAWRMGLASDTLYEAYRKRETVEHFLRMLEDGEQLDVTGDKGAVTSRDCEKQAENVAHCTLGAHPTRDNREFGGVSMHSHPCPTLAQCHGPIPSGTDVATVANAANDDGFREHSVFTVMGVFTLKGNKPGTLDARGAQQFANEIAEKYDKQFVEAARKAKASVEGKAKAVDAMRKSFCLIGEAWAKEMQKAGVDATFLPHANSEMYETAFDVFNRA
jgi:hypothetical protein